MAQQEKEQYVSGEEYRAMSKPSGRKVTIPVQVIGLVAIVIVLCGISFAVGKSYGKKHAGAAVASASAQAQGGFGGQRRAGDIGAVTAVSATSITVTNQRTNASATYTITSSTTISDSGSTVDANDIKVGDNVLITTSGTGSTTATRILVNPSFSGGLGGPGAASGSSSTDSTQSN